MFSQLSYLDDSWRMRRQIQRARPVCRSRIGQTTRAGHHCTRIDILVEDQGGCAYSRSERHICVCFRVIFELGATGESLLQVAGGDLRRFLEDARVAGDPTNPGGSEISACMPLQGWKNRCSYFSILRTHDRARDPRRNREDGCVGSRSCGSSAAGFCGKLGSGASERAQELGGVRRGVLPSAR